jgi:hypothetical protein
MTQSSSRSSSAAQPRIAQATPRECRSLCARRSCGRCSLTDLKWHLRPSPCVWSRHAQHLRERTTDSPFVFASGRHEQSNVAFVDRRNQASRAARVQRLLDVIAAATDGITLGAPRWTNSLAILESLLMGTSRRRRRPLPLVHVLLLNGSWRCDVTPRRVAVGFRIRR